jgi:hypothetical protein
MFVLTVITLGSIEHKTEAVLEDDILGYDLKVRWDRILFKRHIPKPRKPRAQCSVDSIKVRVGTNACE